MKRVPINHYWEFSSFLYTHTHTGPMALTPFRVHKFSLDKNALLSHLQVSNNYCKKTQKDEEQQGFWPWIFKIFYKMIWYWWKGMFLSRITLRGGLSYDLRCAWQPWGKLSFAVPFCSQKFSINLGSCLLELRTTFFAPRRPSVQA